VNLGFLSSASGHDCSLRGGLRGSICLGASSFGFEGTLRKFSIFVWIEEVEGSGRGCSFVALEEWWCYR
jgi:hypothetical protein